MLQYDEYLEWRSQFPVGYLLAKKIADNSKKIIGIETAKAHAYECEHIADPLDSYCTKPDKSIRWKV